MCLYTVSMAWVLFNVYLLRFNCRMLRFLLASALAAIQCLKRKRLYEQQVEQLGNFQLRIHDQVLVKA